MTLDKYGQQSATRNEAIVKAYKLVWAMQNERPLDPLCVTPCVCTGPA